MYACSDSPPLLCINTKEYQERSSAFVFTKALIRTMKKTLRICALILSVIMMIGVMCACNAGDTANLILATNNGEQTNADLVGEWIDLDDDTLTFNADGTCDYFGEACDSYSFDGKILKLTAGDSTVSYDARLFSQYFVIFYESNAYNYTRTAGNSGELVGEWESPEGYTFAFTADGKFTEDGTETGTYAVDGEEIMFIYDDDTDGSYLFNMYDINGDEMTFCYGWALWQE